MRIDEFLNKFKFTIALSLNYLPYLTFYHAVTHISLIIIIMLDHLSPISVPLM